MTPTCLEYVFVRWFACVAFFLFRKGKTTVGAEAQLRVELASSHN